MIDKKIQASSLSTIKTTPTQKNPNESLTVFFVVLLSFFFVGTINASGKEKQGKSHPTLVNLESSHCTTCHDDITNKKFVHSLLKESGCDSCHEMKRVDNKVMVGFVDEGNALCFTCHSEIEKSSTRKFPHAAVEEGCQTCHTPHSSAYQGLLTSSMEELCANCHEIKQEGFKKNHGFQPVARLGCSICHNAHGADEEKLLAGKFRHVPFQAGECNACHKRASGTKIRLRGVGAKLCYACHSDKEKEFFQTSIHTPIKKGNCTGCHDPHMSNHKAMLKNKGKALCLDCHEGIKPLLKAGNVHPPAEESCQNCHSAHASRHTYQLNEVIAKLCLDCHDAEDKGFKTKHYHQAAKDLACSECHNPHGSKSKKLLNTYPHPPFSEKECGSCHEEAEGDKKIKLLQENITDLCLTCHDDKAKDDTKKDLVQHGVMEVESCTVCHSAHASSRRHLLKDHSSRLCITCHQDREKEREEGRFIHPIIDSIGCEACHESHFSKNKNLLIEKPNRLCTECHLRKTGQKPSDKETEVTLFGKIKVKESELHSFKKIILSSDLARGHPQSGHPVSGTVMPKGIKNKRLKGLVFTGELTCLSCHDAHAGAVPPLFIAGTVGRFQLCLKCHIK